MNFTNNNNYKIVRSNLVMHHYKFPVDFVVDITLFNFVFFINKIYNCNLCDRKNILRYSYTFTNKIFTRKYLS